MKTAVKPSIVICMILMVFIVRTAVLADTIYEPSDDFYTKHRNEIQQHEASYTANGPNGQVKGYVSPENAGIKTTIKNGENIVVLFVYKDAAGLTWGYGEAKGHEGFWVAMDYLLTPYSEADFMEQYKNDVSDAGDNELTKATGSWKLYNWPTSSSYKTVEEGTSIGMLSAAYTDEAGVRWNRYVDNKQKAVWVAADDPEADLSQLYSDEIPSLDKRIRNQEIPASAEIVPVNRTLYRNMFYVMLALSMGAMITMAIVINVKISKKYRNRK